MPSTTASLVSGKLPRLRSRKNSSSSTKIVDVALDVNAPFEPPASPEGPEGTERTHRDTAEHRLAALKAAASGGSSRATAQLAKHLSAAAASPIKADDAKAMAPKERDHRLRAVEQAKRLQLEASANGGAQFAGAEYLFGPDGLHPTWWAVGRAQVKAFRSKVVKALRRKQIINQPDPSKPYYYPQERFDSDTIGPNMYQVNQYLIKELTKVAHDGLPGLSYAMQCNLATGGLQCELFFSHAWSEGVFEFIDHALEAWPEECEGAYICTCVLRRSPAPTLPAYAAVP